jgi:hypothetical protein
MQTTDKKVRSGLETIYKYSTHDYLIGEPKDNKRKTQDSWHQPKFGSGFLPENQQRARHSKQTSPFRTPNQKTKPSLAVSSWPTAYARWRNSRMKFRLVSQLIREFQYGDAAIHVLHNILPGNIWLVTSPPSWRHIQRTWQKIYSRFSFWSCYIPNKHEKNPISNSNFQLHLRRLDSSGWSYYLIMDHTNVQISVKKIRFQYS